MYSVYKAANLTTDEVKFQAWKIKKGSKLSIGSVLFTYEYVSASDGALKSEKFKSKTSGMTVKELCEINPGDIIKFDTPLFTYEVCSHPIRLNEMCGVCGEDLKVDEPISAIGKGSLAKKADSGSNGGSSGKHNNLMINAAHSTHLPMLHSEPHIRVDRDEALELGKKDLINLVKSRKLVLLVDLDHTVIHTTNEHVNKDIKDIYHYELNHKNIWYHTKFRPGCEEFLKAMSEIFELHMVTFGERNYAHTIANLMDKDRKYFHDRILSRNEIFNPVSKTDNLKALFPRGDLMVCIIDDREDVWNYARNLVCVKPYVYFKNTGDINDPSLNNRRKRKLQSSTGGAENKESSSDPSLSSPSEVVVAANDESLTS